MTLANIINTIKMLALKHPNINSAYEGNIYDILNAKPDNKYASIVITQQSHSQDELYDHYGFVIFYVDRLVDDLEDNRVQIQSIGKSMLSNIITAFCNEFEAECENITYQPFTQRFADETAGVYATITIDAIKDAFCAEKYWDESWSAPILTIRNVDKSITITENGNYIVDYDATQYTGIERVTIDVELPLEEIRNESYEQGQQDVVANARVLDVTENGQYGDGETLYKTINVNVKPKINVAETGLRFGYSTFTEVPEWAYFKDVTDMSNMFEGCYKLTNVPIDTSNVTNMFRMFYYCSSLTTAPNFDTHNVTNMDGMFYNCNNLTTVPLFNTSKVTNMNEMFASCSSLTTIPQLDTSNVTSMNRMFYNFGGIKSLVSLPKFDCSKVTNMGQYFSYYADGMSNLTDVGGWENLSCDWNDRYGLASCPNLTYQSCINILNGLYDFSETTTTKTLKVHPNFLTTVGDEISIGTNKNWLISA